MQSPGKRSKVLERPQVAMFLVQVRRSQALRFKIGKAKRKAESLKCL